MKMLEKMFAHEVERAVTHKDSLPFQTRAKGVMARLEKEGMVAYTYAVIVGHGPAVRVEGWELTHLGRLTYGTSC